MSLFQTMTPTKTSGDLVAFGENVFFYVVNRSRKLSWWTTLTTCVGRSGGSIGTKYVQQPGNYWRCFKQIRNTGTLYERENKARGVVTCTQLSGFTQPVLSPISNPYYLLDRAQAVAQEYARRQWYLPCRSTPPATARGHVWSIPFCTYTRDLET